MAADGRAVESRELRAVQPDRRASRDSYQHGADGRRGDTQSTHHHCERRILAEWHGPSAHHRHFRQSARPLRARYGRGAACCAPTQHAFIVPDGRHPQNDAHAGAATRGPSPGDAPEGTPACRRGRGHYDLRPSDRAGSLDLPRTVALAGWHPARDRERCVGGRERPRCRGRRTGESGTGTTMTDARDLSRRDFLAASAIGLIGLARGSEKIDGDLLYVGTYTEGTRSEGLYLLRMDRRSGKLQR